MYQTIKGKLATSDIPTASEMDQMVLAKVPQGYEAKVNVRLVPGRDFVITPAVIGCQPRQGTTRRDAYPVPLPEGLVEKLKDANKKVVDWLALDEANAKLFLSKPLEALSKAGVDLTRAEQKALERTHRAVRDTAVVAPGVNIAQLSVSGNPKGRVGDSIKGAKPKGTREGDSGCVSEGKG